MFHSKKKKPSNLKIRRDPAVFEKAFTDRLGRGPSEFIADKLRAGTSLKDARYLFDIISAEIAAQNHCKAGKFDSYHKKVVFSVPIVKTYHKLVRDRIPEIIRASGKRCTVETLSDEKYISLLDAKLNEELAEYQESKSLEELADLLEVMGAVVKARGYTWEELTTVRKKKREDRGGFEKRILLKEVYED